jgi:hypothetical protein
MKSKVMDRPMFKGKEDDPEEVGIMSLLMGEDDDDEDMSSLMDRRPDSPEILMNNLRGDVRSVDARFEELADMVGYGAAQQTPPEVLALLQPVLAAEQQGIAALPATAPGGAPAGIPTPPPPVGMPPGPGAAPPPMPPEAAGIGSLPQGMAMGGPVQRFRRGSDEDGVEPADTEPSEDDATGGAGRAGLGAVNYARAMDPAQVTAAKAAFARLFKEPPQSTETLEQATARKTRLYQSLLGQDKTATQAQMLFDLAGAGLALAGNVDPRTGQPMRGSFAARLAGAASQLPAQIGARASEAEKMAQQIKALGLQAAEKEQESDRAARLRREQLIAGIGKEILRGEAAESVANIRAGKAAADKGMTPAVMNALMSNPELVREFASGVNSADTTRLEFAIKNYTQPKTEQYIDPQTNMPVMRTTRNELPGYLSEAISARAKALGSRPTAQAPAPAAMPAPAPAGAMPAPAPAPAATTAPVMAPAPATTAQAPVPPAGQAVPTSLYRLASTGTGPLNMLRAGVSRVPLIGGMVDPKYEQSVTEINNSVAQMVKSLQETTRMANAERVDIEERLSALPRFIDRPDAFQNRLIALDNVLSGIEQGAVSRTQEANIGASRRQEAEQKASEVRRIRQMIGLPTRIYSAEQAKALEPGTEFLYVPTNKFMVRK